MKHNTNDGLQSLISGMGNPERDKLAATGYTRNYFTDEYLLTIYESSWIAQKIADIPAQDMLRKWRTWSGNKSTEIETLEKKLKLTSKLLDCKIKARVMGGAAVFIGTDQQDKENELSPKAKLKYLTVLDRRELTAGDIEKDPLKDQFGKPQFYQVAGSTETLNIHPSHFIIMGGRPSIDSMDSRNKGWDASVIEYAYDAIKQADTTVANIASLVFEAKVDVIKIPDFTKNLSGDSSAQYEEVVLKKGILTARAKGINGMLMLDALEEYQSKSASLATTPDLMELFVLMAGASDGIPASRFIKQATGLSNSGSGEMKIYHDKIQAMQTNDLANSMSLFDELLINNAGGSDDSYEWNPLEQMSEKELAEIGKMTTESLKNINDLGSFSSDELRELSIHKLGESGAFPHIDTIVGETKEKLELPDDKL